MVRRKDMPVLHIILILIMFLSLSSEKHNDIPVSFPVILRSAADQKALDPEGEAVNLFINGERREITGFHRVVRQLRKESDLARDFILSFSVSKPDEHIKNSLSFFLTEILKPSDTLSFVTPGKVFRIKVTPSKEGMADTAYRILERECRSYNKGKLAFSKSMRNELVKILNVLSDTSDSSSVFKVRRYKKIIGFLNSFPGEFNRFLQHSIVLNMNRYESAVSDIKFRSGEKWWIHFHRRESGRLFSRIGKVIKEIEEYSSTSGDLFEQDHAPLLKRLRRLLYSVEFFPSEEIREKMLKAGISFHSVQYAASSDKEHSVSGNEKSVFDRIFDDIAAHTGGSSGYAVNPEDELEKLADRDFLRYTVEFKFNGKIEDKSIVLKGDSGRLPGIHYPGKISSEEMKSIVDHQSREKCTVNELKLAGNTISFRIRGYKFLPDQNAGLLKVRLEILSGQGKILHSKENILRSPVRDLFIRIPRPKDLSGEVIIRITVVDLVANIKTWDEVAVTLI